MSNSNNLTAAQRASMFAQATRQNMQMLPSASANTDLTSLQFTLPKARLLSSIMAWVEVKVKATHGSTGGNLKVPFADVHNIIRRWSLDLNNGFSPYTVGGRELYYLNALNGTKGYYDIMDAEDKTVNGTIAMEYNPSGAVNTIAFPVEMPVTINERDAVGLILLQNDQTNVTLTADVNNVNNVFKADGVTFAVENITITPLVTTFSVPAMSDAFPDLSVLKLVNSRVDNYSGAGQHIVRLSTGTIYRRMVVRFTDENGTPLTVDEITSNIDIVFNQADVNYSIAPKLLRALNSKMYGYQLPDGVYSFDFTYQGIANMGGSRDFIDTERLTEFWLRFSTSKTVKVEIVTECLARLQ